MGTKLAQAINVFYSYAHEDEALRNELEKHLSVLQRQGVVVEWHDRRIMPGTDWQHEIDTHLNTANVVLLLISPDFLASDYCYGIEALRALERHERGKCCVIPILLRPVDWQNTPFAYLQRLPREKAITEYSNQDVAFREVAVGIHQTIEHLPSSPRSVSFTDPGNSQKLLQRVRSFWVEGVLEDSLYHATRIALGLEKQPDAIANPFRMVMQESDQSACPLPLETKITHAYEKTNGRLLILGEPGAGKTTLLLELARDLLDRAEHGELQSLPVVFNLFSWAQERRPLSVWLVEELCAKYRFPREIAQAWIDTDQILPLLDGLDEVAESYRTACLTAINAYLKERHLLPMVVCSRKREYAALTTQLELDGAVCIQPLTLQQVDEYLASGRPQLEAVRGALHEDAGLQELTTTPLMLNVLALAYQGMSVEDLIGVPMEKQRQLVFEQYVKQVLKRGASASYTLEQTKHWLSWLAKQMKQRNITVFYARANMRHMWRLFTGPTEDTLKFVLGRKAPHPDSSITEDWMPTQGKRWTLRGISIAFQAIAMGAGGARVGGVPGAALGGAFGALVGAFNHSTSGLEEVMQFHLWQAGVAPSNYPHFLDYAAEHILLRKVGDGYIFIHQLLLDYFASLDISNLNNISPTTD